jgi:hypothetical protein
MMTRFFQNGFEYCQTTPHKPQTNYICPAKCSKRRDITPKSGFQILAPSSQRAQEGDPPWKITPRKAKFNQVGILERKVCQENIVTFDGGQLPQTFGKI